MMFVPAVLLLVVGVQQASAQQSAYGQCGGTGWTGATSCIAGYACSTVNAYYYQCVPGAATPAPTSSRATTVQPSPTSVTSARTSTAASAPASSPSNVAGSGVWASAYAKANVALAKLTNAQKVSLATGIGWEKGPCVGNLAAISAIGFPSLCLQDSPLGVRYAKSATAFPAGIMAAATWDISLMKQRGAALGAESKALGVHVQLGPVAGPLGKIPQGGRGWEGFSPDPYLTGIAMQQTINGMQSSGVQACAKHFIGNEQEHNRETMSSNIADRVMHELYLWPFADSVQAGVASVMCSYNKLNTTYACENNALLTGILKNELGFQGYVVSDWTAQHTTTGSANAGMDMSMPGDNFGDNNFLWGQNLLNAVSSGQVSQSRLDDIARRVLASWYLLGQDSGYPATGFSSWGGNGGPNVQGTHSTVARAVARDGIVLLKNTNNALPLNKPASLAIIGQDAIVNPSGPNACVDRQCDTGTLAMGWGSGTAEFPYLTDPLSAIKAQGTTIITSTTDSTTSAATAAKSATTAIVFINADSGEGYITVEGNAGDRNNLDPWHSGNDLVKAVAAVNKNTIVVVHSVGPLILEQFISLPNVTAVVWAGIPGQESGNALVDVLYGSVSPSGKLPYTIAKQAADYGTSVVSGDDSFGEGLYIDYRHFDQAGIAPRFEFGFGLSYANFTYASLKLPTLPITRPSLIPKTDATTLYTPAGTVTATITNTGSWSGSASEIAQLYITLPASAPAGPPRQLRGFQKVSIAKGASAAVSFELRWKDLAYWDAGAQGWRVPSGAFGVAVGASSRDLRLNGSF